MTEETVKKAIEIVREIDRLREKKQQLESQQNLCWETAKFNFNIEIRDGGTFKEVVSISRDAAEKALECDIKTINANLKYWEKELSKL